MGTFEFKAFGDDAEGILAIGGIFLIFIGQLVPGFLLVACAVGLAVFGKRNGGPV